MKRTEAYRTVTSMTVAQVARELGVSRSFVNKLCRQGQLKINEDGTISGRSLADYLEANEVKQILPGSRDQS